MQLKRIIEEQVHTGTFPPGTRIPTEHELSQQYGVSRITVQQAVRQLVHEGLLVRQAGRGTFVANQPVEDNLLKFINFVMETPAIEGGHQVISAKVTLPYEHEAAVLKLEPTDPVVRLERLKFERDRPVAYEHTLIPFRVCPNLLEEDLGVLNLYDYFRRIGVRVVDARMYLEPYVLPQDVARHLRLDPGTPAFLWERISWDSNRSPVELSKFVIRSDTRRFYVHYSI
nr:GntR family transcriptional regulator [Alicyclobacillus macrosporangiidus]